MAVFKLFLLFAFLHLGVGFSAHANSCETVFSASAKTIETEIAVDFGQIREKWVSNRNYFLKSLPPNSSYERILPETEWFPWRWTQASHKRGDAWTADSSEPFGRLIGFMRGSSPRPRLSIRGLSDGLEQALGSKLSLQSLSSLLDQAGMGRRFTVPQDSVTIKPLTYSDFESQGSVWKNDPAFSWHRDLDAVLARVKSLPSRERDSALRGHLAEGILNYLVMKRNQGDDRSEDGINASVESVARAVRDWMILSPLHDRSEPAAHLLAWIAMRDMGLPPPLLLDVRESVGMDAASWSHVFKAGVRQRFLMLEDLSDRAKHGLPVAQSPWLAFPGLPTSIIPRIKLHHRDASEEGTRKIQVDPGQFIAFAKATERNAGADSRLGNDPVGEARALYGRYQDFASRTHLDFFHSKKHWESIHLELADPDFLHLFGVVTAKNKATYDYKMKRWYMNEIVWRGWSHADREVPEGELIKMFTQPSGQSVANSVLSAVYRNSAGHHITARAKQSLERMNSDLIGWSPFFQMMKDHHQEGPLYTSSYGFSTSKEWIVGRAFAMGAMKVADYGQQHLHQDKLKSRVLIGLRRAKKDVDQGRLHQFDKTYQYIYGRQQEITGIGMAEPDALVFVQRVSAQGEPEMTLMRSPEDPSVLIKIEGGFRFDKNEDWTSFPHSRIRLPLD